MNINIDNFIQDPDNPTINFDLGYKYEQEGQTASAISHYLRAAERTDDTLLQYESLVRMAICFEKQGDRVFTVKGCLQRAISTLPDRPEAYYLLSRLHERSQEYHDTYMLASVGLGICNLKSPPLRTNVEYPGEYVLYFEKAVSAWWVGLCDESKQLFYDIKCNYNLDPVHSEAVERNLLSIGYPSTIYEKKMVDQLRYKFTGVEEIEKNYSQSFQDLFVLSMLNGKRNGLYLEIGSSIPFDGNNTALLETKFDWKGISIDIDEKCVKEFFEKRRNTVVCLDATDIDYNELLRTFGLGDATFDYLQVDCDPAETTFEILKKIPFDTHKFAVVTFEHDYYRNPKVKDLSREFLKSKGYYLVAGDVAFNSTNSYEDWWVYPELIDPQILHKMTDLSDGPKYAKTYMLPGAGLH